MIPRLTHQTAPSAALTPEQTALRGKLIALNPGWTHLFYDDAACRDLIRSALPGFLPIYDAAPLPVQRADIFRVAAVWAHGGVYLDLDMDCARGLADLRPETCVLAEEKTLSAEDAAAHGHAERLRIANYMFASAPKHPFWLDVLGEMAARAGRPVQDENDVLEATGPGLFSTVFARARHPGIRVLALPQGARCTRCGAAACQFGDYAAHLHHGSWRFARRVPPPAPAPDPAPARNALRVLRGDMAPGVTVLKTYDGPPQDGLSGVYDLVRPLGPEVADTSALRGRKVIVAGAPFLYADRLSPANTNIAFTTFETSAPPAHWVDAINRHYHHCAVPHDRVRRAFAAAGVAVPLHVVPQGFARRPTPPPAPRIGGPVIGFNGVPVRRKNLGALYAACRMLAPSVPGLRLAVHVAAWYDWLNPHEWGAMRRDPMVIWTEGRLTDAEMGAWYAGLDCYAYPSRAEGWSFTPRESLFHGVPTLVSGIEMHRDMIESGFCAEIPSRGPEPALYEAGVFGDWDRIDPEDIAEALAALLADLAAARAQAALGAAWIETRWRASDAQCALADLAAAL
jgi:glycosyltransferase involved in cell wall biosynthesis